MSYFNYYQHQLFAEECSLIDIANKFGTPCYVYSRKAIESAWLEVEKACGDHPHQICYAVKANSNLAVLNILARLGSGFDIVSGGELARVIKAGGDPQKIIFSGVGKQDDEIIAALTAGIACFNVESFFELEQINTIAASLGKVAPIALRINPDISIETHPYMTTGLKENKFGVPFEHALTYYQHAATLPHLKIRGIACHLGSQIMTIEPYVSSINMLLSLIDALAKQNIIIKHLDIGGGFGVRYRLERPAPLGQLLNAVFEQLKQRDIIVSLEPGRAIVATAGVLLAKVLSVKSQPGKNFAITDSGMNDLLRPALYEAWHEIIPVVQRDGKKTMVDVVGPVCESGDFLGKDRELCVEANDYLAVMLSGAYGFVLSSNFNTRPRAAEVMVDKDKVYLVRPRETLQDLLAGETCLPS